jgi:universal stress protein E
MKNEPRRILLAIRAPLRLSPAVLRKVAKLCRASGASLELFHATEAAGVEALRFIEERLNRIADSTALKNLSVRICAVEDSPPHEAIIKRAQRARSDLVIAATHPHAPGGRWFLRNTDWELIRYCPVSLLLLKSSRPYDGRSLLIAVDPFHAHAKPVRLDQDLLKAGSALGRLLSRPVHVFHAYMPLIANVQGTLGEVALWEGADVEQVHRMQVQREFDRLADRAHIAAARRHLIMGDISGELEATAKRVKAGIVVMGAVSRSGLKRLFIGNTAESALDRLGCDVLVIKPRGFKAPAWSRT